MRPSARSTPLELRRRGRPGAGPWALALLVLASGVATGETYPLRDDGDTVVGRLTLVAARYEDTLLDIGRRFDMGYTELRLANPAVDTFLPGEGTSVLVPSQFVLPNAPYEGLVLNLPEMRLYYYPEPEARGSRRVVTHPVSIGRIGWETPQGLTRVVAKVEDPTWFPPKSIRAEHAAKGAPLPARVPPGPDNPLGRHAIRLGWPQYLIHGTNRPYSIGMRVSHGCVRMYPEDIERLFASVAPGAPVRVINQPAKVGWLGTDLYLEVHPAAAELRHDGEPDITRSVWRIVEAVPEKEWVSVDWAAVERISVERRGIPRVIGRRLDSAQRFGTDPEVERGAQRGVVESLW